MGKDKAFLEIDGVPLWQRQIQLLESLAPKQIFIAGPSRAEWTRAGCKVISDAQINAGPLAGLIAGLRACESQFLLALAVDLPRMTADCLKDLLKFCAHDCGVVPMTDGLEPLAAIYPSAARALAEEQLAQGRYSLQQFVRRCLDDGFMREQLIASEDAALFLNLNTPADWSTAFQSQ